MSHTQVLIQGSGIVAHVAALALARLGLKVALTPQRPAPGHGDVRAYAINAASRRLLESVKVWQARPAQAACPVQAMRIQADDGASLAFDTPQDQEALTWIVDVPLLEQTLRDAVRFNSGIRELSPAESAQAELTLICEGRASAARDALGVEFDITPYGHTAMATRVRADQPHAQVARQWFGRPHRGDVLALLPLAVPDAQGNTGQTLAIVWSVQAAHVAELLACDAEAFENALTQATDNALGRLHLCSERLSWPLQSAVARRVTGAGWVLLGDAAHSIHPLAGQGLNLGLADVQALAQVLQTQASHRSVGDARLLRRYERTRSLDVLAMTQGNDALFRVFGHPISQAQSLRKWGLGWFDRSTSLKSWTMRKAMGL
jgi:2-polyprenyl-6-methoxyphenol hydroxylase-like FAD-dependent oxidoreductase